MGKNILLKGQCYEIFNNFFGLHVLKDSTYEQAKTVSLTFSCSQRYSIAKIKKILCPRSHRLHGQPKFSLDTAVFKILNHCCWMCPCSHWYVRLVVDYADTASMYSLTTPTPCSRIQRLRWHQSLTTQTRNFRKYQIIFFVTFLLVFYFFQNEKVAQVKSLSLYNVKANNI